MDIEIILDASEVEASDLRCAWARRSTCQLRAPEREPQLHLVEATDDLFEYQAIQQGGWVMAGVALWAV